MNNKIIFEESKNYIPGGVNSPVRAMKNLGITPPIIKSGKGVHIYDEDGNEYIDFLGAWGPMLLGHCDDSVQSAMKTTLEEGIAFGAPTKLELDLAKMVCSTTGIEMIRMVNSGTEATMSAVKLARGYTGKNKIIKFSGCYHGHYDGFLVSAGSGVMTNSIPGSAGVPQEHINNTLIAEYNDSASVEKLFNLYPNDIACVIVEPVAGNMGVVKGSDNFITDLYELCEKFGALLIFDEVMCGFRVAYKGAQEIFDIKPHLVTYGKIIGGGLPCGAFGGKKEIMEMLSPLGPVYQAGTMSGNSLVMSAGLATLDKLYSNPNYYKHLENIGAMLENGLMEIAKKKSISLKINRVGSMMTIFFTDLSEVKNYDDAQSCNVSLFNKFYLHMLKEGIYLPPSQFESIFLSVLHTEVHVEKFLAAFDSFNPN